tara:strand:+ start:298 stop:780 length:483 start_codon:yes stop_codon:yes gene_type:complete
MPPAPEAPAAIAALYGPGVSLFGKDVVDSLLCRAEGVDGIIPPELTNIVNACGGAAKWHGFVGDCVEHLKQQPGGLISNWFALGSAQGGPYGVCCLTCGSKSTTLGGGQSTTTPFNNFLVNHLRGATRSLTMMKRILKSIHSRMRLGWWLSRCQGEIVTT